MAPDNPKLKLIRLRTFVYFPNRYYGHLRKVIDADAGAVLDWVEEYLRAAGQDGELAGFFPKSGTKSLSGGHLLP